MLNVQREGALLWIRFTRPEKKNALTGAMYRAMTDAVERAEQDPEIRVMVFAGSGDTFTAGNDLADFAAAGDTGQEILALAFLKALSEASKIVIAAVNGAAIGIGTTMLLHCDLVVAGRRAKFRLPFVDLGLVPEAASSLLLPRLVGHQRAVELLVLGEQLDAAGALDARIVTRIVESDDTAEVETEARKLADAIAAKPAEAVRLTKKLMKSETDTVRVRMAEEAVIFGERLRSAEVRDILRAFLERRPPVPTPNS